MSSIQELIAGWDGDYVISAHDAETGAWIFIAMHDRTLGMALGGCRFKTYPAAAEGLRDAMRLSAGMTRKWAAIGFPFGGGKTVIAHSRPLDENERERLLLRLGDIIDSLAGSYGTGCDMGTTPADMVVIGHRTRWVFGRPEGQGGHGDPGPWTARGVDAGIRAACRHAFGEASVEGRSVLVQGAGGVGARLAERLHAAGARVRVTDITADRAAALATRLGIESIEPDDAIGTDCDIFSPCAVGGILDERSIARLRCRVVAGSANNQLQSDADADRLHERGILYAPDYVINAGGAIAHAALELLDWDEERTAVRVDEIGQAIDEILAEAAERDESPKHGADRRAERVLAAARARNAG